MNVPDAPIDPRADYLKNPISLGTTTPRLSWILPLGEGRGRRQTAYQVLASTSAETLARGVGNLWDTGRVESGQSIHVLYAGRSLTSRSQAFWKVRIWDENGAATEFSEPSSFEIGLLAPGDWAARWIRADARWPIGQELQEDQKSSVVERNGRRFWPAPHLRREFDARGEVKQARLYVTARGLYEVQIDGQRVGSAELAPGWTDYRARIHYQTYDVTRQLSTGSHLSPARSSGTGAHAIGVILGDGWYCGYVGFGGRRELYGVDPELLLQLEIEYVDGTRETIATDENWRWRHGPILFSDMLEGEHYDARRELGAWSTAGFDDDGWMRVTVSDIDGVPIEPQPDMPVTVTEEITPKSITALGKDRYLVDMGQNMVGRVKLRVSGPAGSTVTLRHAEVLTEGGELYVDNLRAASQADVYVPRGKCAETFEPRFTFHGFRYVEISGCPGELTVDDIRGRVLESQTETAGQFETGHAMVNQLVRNILWGQRGNFVSLPTDCPQRDERLGWMGDAQVFARTAAYNRNVAAFFTKWLADVRDAQHKSGFYTDTCPSALTPNPGAPAWADAGVIVPWTIYQMYGDLSILESSYESMARYVAALEAANPEGIWKNARNSDYGDWLSIDADTPKDLLATAYLAYDALLMSRIAAALGREDDQKRYARLFVKVKSAFNQEFVEDDVNSSGAFKIHGDTQTVYLLALHMSLLDPAKRAEAARRLAADIEAKGTHLSTGFIGVGFICPILTEFGYADIAYRLLLNETYPSWGYSIAHGATTIWERWDGWTEHKGFHDPGMNSFNHYCFGSVGEWLYRSVAGIDVDPDQPGFKTIVMRPEPNRELGFVEATYQSRYGEIASAWRYEGGDWLWDVTVPANTTAVAYLPTTDTSAATELGSPTNGTIVDGRVAVKLEPGRYAFRVKMEAAK